MLISFEGIDGCGKTTQIKLLKEYFTKLGHKITCVREPGGTIISEKIRTILLDKENDIRALTELMLFGAARSELMEQIVKPALNRGEIVLSDRFTDSTLAYQGYGRKLELDTICRLNEIATGMTTPNITFYLQLPLNISKSRTDRNNLDRIEQDTDNFLQRVIDGFDSIAKHSPERVVIIDATQNIDKVFENIKMRLKAQNIV